MAVLMPEGKQSFTDSKGAPLVGGKLFTYETGTSTPRVTYQDAASTIPNTNPVILDARGEATVFWSGAYKVVLKDAADVTIWSVDNTVSTDVLPTTLDTLLRAELGASSGSSMPGFVQLGAGAVVTNVQNKLRESMSVIDFGADPTGATNSRLAIKRAVAAVNAAGGGTLVFPPGDYLISGMDGSYSLPELSTSIQWSTASSDVQMYFSGLNAIVFTFNGSRLVSNKTDGGATILLDGCTNLTFNDLSMSGATVMSGSTPTTTGTSAVAIYSTTQNSDNITFNEPKLDKHYSGIDIVGNPASAYRVRNVVIGGAASIRNGYYGVLCRGNGVNVRVLSAYTYRLNRPFFVYDTSGVDIKMICDEMNGGFQALVKAYTVDTASIQVDMVVKSRANTSSCLGLQSQHNPALQPTPAVLRDINIAYEDFSSVAGGESIRLDYYRDSTLTTTTNELVFSGITVSGRASGKLISSVTLTATARFCVINTQSFSSFDLFSIYTVGGFIPARVSAWTPVDASAGGLVLATASCSYTVGDTVFGIFSITFPVTADTSPVSIGGLPVASKVLAVSCQPITISYTNCGLSITGLIGAGSKNINLYNLTGISVKNVELSGKTIRGSFMYLA